MTEAEKYRDRERRGFILEDHEEIVVLRDDVNCLRAEIERLRKALQTIADNEIAEYPDEDMIRDFAYAALRVNK